MTLPVTPTPIVITHTYDAVGNRLTMNDDTGTTTYVYDAVYRLTSVTDPSANAVGYGYDNVGNRTTLTYHDGKVVTYTFDAANRMKTPSRTGAAGSPPTTTTTRGASPRRSIPLATARPRPTGTTRTTG